jgi:hypothetical protein
MEDAMRFTKVVTLCLVAFGALLFAHAGLAQSISLWKVDAKGEQVNFKEHGPFEGWKPLNCANNNVLWRHEDGRISLWVVDDEGKQVSFKEHGPFDGWKALNYADGRILWHSR